jgi:hypothetical protein
MKRIMTIFALAMSAFLGACDDNDGVSTDPVVPDEVTNADASMCQRACDALSAGMCGTCAGSCDAAPVGCTVYFACVLEPTNAPDTCDDIAACDDIIDTDCASWRG